MIPVIAIVGRPNVGKSTLFNRLTKTRDALVADMPGVTRDRQYGEAQFGDKHVILIDTGGIGEEEQGAVDGKMSEQSWQAVDEADIVMFMLDARSGLTPADEAIAKRLRRMNKTLFVVMNKVDGIDVDDAVIDFYKLGFGEPLLIAASHGRGVTSMMEKVLADVEVPEDELSGKDAGIKLAVIGKPNVGKSTLINRMLGEERVVVFDMPGTTRDSIFIPMERRGKKYTLIDTAGVRRKQKVSDALEKFSIIKALKAIEAANVVIFVIDARENIAEQDLKLLGFILNAGKSLVIAVNKWDNMEESDRDWVKRELSRRLAFVDFARIHFISALHGTGVGDLYKYVNEAYKSSMLEVPTAKATALLEEAIKTHQPPLVNNRRPKLRYAHIGGHNPPVIVIHGNQLTKLPGSYKRYLVKFYRDKLNMIGTPVQLELKTTDNPFAGQKNKNKHLKKQVTKTTDKLKAKNRK